jgi:hypothetical protein
LIHTLPLPTSFLTVFLFLSSLTAGRKQRDVDDLSGSILYPEKIVADLPTSCAYKWLRLLPPELILVKLVHTIPITPLEGIVMTPPSPNISQYLRFCRPWWALGGSCESFSIMLRTIRVGLCTIRIVTLHFLHGSTPFTLGIPFQFSPSLSRTFPVGVGVKALWYKRSLRLQD